MGYLQLILNRSKHLMKFTPPRQLRVSFASLPRQRRVNAASLRVNARQCRVNPALMPRQ
jgi:hypothetical protein